MCSMLTVSSVFELEVDFYNWVVDHSLVLRYLFSEVCASACRLHLMLRLQVGSEIRECRMALFLRINTQLVVFCVFVFWCFLFVFF